MDLKPSTLFQIIHELSTQAHSIQLLCHLAKVSRSGYYKWVTDITHLIFNGQKLYLSAIKDLYNNEIVACQISRRNDYKLVLNTFKKAIKGR